MQHLVAQLAQLPDRYIVRWQFSLVNVVAVIPIISPIWRYFLSLSHRRAHQERRFARGRRRNRRSHDLRNNELGMEKNEL